MRVSLGAYNLAGQTDRQTDGRSASTGHRVLSAARAIVWPCEQDGAAHSETRQEATAEPGGVVERGG